MTAFLARGLDANTSTQPASAGNRRFSDRPKPILALSSNLDCTAGWTCPGFVDGYGFGRAGGSWLRS